MVTESGKQAAENEAEVTSKPSPEKPVRADAKRNLDAILVAAKDVFATSGVDAPVREIAQKAGFGVGTLYRHFPNRAELIAAVFRREVDACADTAASFAETYPPFEALALWMQRYAGFIATKRGLASALHSGDPAFSALPGHFDKRLRPALQMLLDAAIEAGEARQDIEADDLLNAIARLCMTTNKKKPKQGEEMVALLTDGLRHNVDKVE